MKKPTQAAAPSKSALAKQAAQVIAADHAAEQEDMATKAARLQQLTEAAPAPALIAIRDNDHITAIEDRRVTPAIEVVVQQVTAVPTKAERKSAAAAKRIREQVAEHIGTTGDGKQVSKLADGTLAVVDHGPSNKLISDMLKREAADAPVAPPIPATGYQGPMKALRDRVKAGAYKKAANGQPSCGDEVAQILGQLEPTEVIGACLIAMDISNPYTHLNIGQQSMNLRNKLRGQLKRAEIGMGVVREAVEVVIETRAAKAPAPAQAAAPAPAAPEAPAAEPAPAPAPAKAPRKSKAKSPREAQGK